MTNDEKRLAKLDALLGEIPQAVDPERDLWPDIEAALDIEPQSTGGFWRMALAATLIAGVALALVSQMPTNDPSVEHVNLLTTPSLSPDVIEPPLTALRPTAQLTSFPGDGYGAVRSAQLATLEQSLGRLPPAERQTVLDNLDTIRRAIDEIDSALADQPDSVLLKELLLSSYQQELLTINRVNRLAVSIRDDL